MIGAYLVHALTLKTFTKSNTGEVTSTTSISIRGRIKYRDKVVRSFHGQEVQSRAEVLVRSRTFNADDVLVFPDGSEHVILNTRDDYDFSEVGTRVYVS